MSTFVIYLYISGLVGLLAYQIRSRPRKSQRTSPPVETMARLKGKEDYWREVRECERMNFWA